MEIATKKQPTQNSICVQLLSAFNLSVILPDNDPTLIL